MSMRFRLRTLLILLAVGPPMVWAAWQWRDYFEDTTPVALANKGGGATQYIDDPALSP
jgi:hypothetical protein